MGLVLLNNKNKNEMCSSAEAWVMKISASLLGGTVLEMFLKSNHFVAFMCMLIICDMITGVFAASKRKEEIRISTGLRRTLTKFVMYSMAIYLSAGMQEFLNIPQVVYAVALYICTTEFISNLENIGEVTGVNVAKRVKEFLAKKIQE